MEIKNYTLISAQPMEEYNGTAYIFEHNKTKAPIFYLSCPDDNKVFCIAFPTPPENDKGIPHILEHCVLNGSRKFPVKEPFVELLKGSLNTFVNAMTYNDKTVFPVASCNDKDFKNLMDVYLDAVFYPNLRKDPFIMQQEGWHYEMTDPDGDISYKGVVLNEMKGAYSSPERRLYLETGRGLYPDTVYSTESGGYPEAIPDLTYEEFTAFHEKYYHPSNSRIFFYGNGDIEEHLRFLDEEYLSNFDYSESRARITVQPPFDAIRRAECRYPGEEGDGKDYLSLNFVIPPVKDAVEYYALPMMMRMLAGDEDAPVRKALTEAEIGKEINAEIDVGIYNPTVSIIAKGANAADEERFLRIIREESEKAARDGFDKKLVEGILNSTEFAQREADYGTTPKGLVIGLTALDSWLYDPSDPMGLLAFNEVFAELRKRADNGYFEELVRSTVLNNTHGLVMTMKPDATMAERIQQQEADKLAAYKATLSPEQRKALCEETAAILKRQSEPDSKEALETIPLLAKEDIEREIERVEVKFIDGKVPGRYAPLFTGGIAYGAIAFNARFLSEEELPYLGLLSVVLGSLSTEHYSYSELDNELNIATGGLDTDVDIVRCYDTGDYRLNFLFGARYLYGYRGEAVELMKEILCRSDFSDMKRLKELVSELRSMREASMMRRGDRVALGRAQSRLNEVGRAKELTSGLEFFLFIRELEAHFDERAEETAAKLRAVLDKVVRRNNAELYMTDSEEDIPVLTAELTGLVETLPDGDPAEFAKKTVLPVEKLNEGILTSGQIQYVVKLGKFDRPTRGSMEVLSKIVGMDYLWTNIRVKGGAYGSSRYITRGGEAGFSSYRDPNLTESLAVYDSCAAAMKTFDCDERELTKYIIGTISDITPVRSTAGKGDNAIHRSLSGTSIEYLQRHREEVIDTTLEQLREDAEIFDEAMKNAVICVQGSKEKLLANKELFDNMIEIL